MIDRDYIILNLIAAVPSLVLAAWRNRVLHKRNPAADGFMWGYFTGFRILMVGSFLCLCLLFVSGTEGIPEDTAMGLAVWITVVMVVPGVFILLRHRWAWILYTVCSMNPVLWVINGVYIRNRWVEIRDARSDRVVPISPQAVLSVSQDADSTAC